MTATHYIINTKDFDEIVAKFNTAGINNWQIGETSRFTFELPDFAANKTFSSDHTVVDVEGYNDVTIESGVTVTVASGAILQADTITVNGTLVNNGTVYTTSGTANALVDYIEWAGSYSTVETLDNSIRYKTQLPSNAGISSLVWGIEPADNLQNKDVQGVWALVEGVQNTRNQPLTTNRYTFDLRVLDTFSSYSSLSDVENSLLI